MSTSPPIDKGWPARQQQLLRRREMLCWRFPRRSDSSPSLPISPPPWSTRSEPALRIKEIPLIVFIRPFRLLWTQQPCSSQPLPPRLPSDVGNSVQPTYGYLCSKPNIGSGVKTRCEFYSVKKSHHWIGCWVGWWLVSHPHGFFLLTGGSSLSHLSRQGSPTPPLSCTHHNITHYCVLRGGCVFFGTVLSGGPLEAGLKL